MNKIKNKNYKTSKCIISPAMASSRWNGDEGDEKSIRNAVLDLVDGVR